MSTCSCKRTESSLIMPRVSISHIYEHEITSDDFIDNDFSVDFLVATF